MLTRLGPSVLRGTPVSALTGSSLYLSAADPAVQGLLIGCRRMYQTMAQTAATVRTNPPRTASASIMSSL